MIYSVRHLTEVRYATMVQLARFNLRLKPADWPGQTLHDYKLKVTPRPASFSTQEGGYIVNVSRVALLQPISQLHIESSFRVEIVPGAELDMTLSPDLATLKSTAVESRDLTKLGPAFYLFPSPVAHAEREIARWAYGIVNDNIDVVSAGNALMAAIYNGFTYDGEATEADTAPIEAFHKRRGVCQDFTHIMIIAARALGIPAAYVSGYLRTIPPPGKERLVGADATHAWVNLWCGEALGWIGFDPTNNVLAQTDHIFTAMGRDYGDVAPLDGVFLGSAGQQMRTSVDVVPLENVSA